MSEGGSGPRSFAPRRMDLARLIEVLVEEHAKMREGMQRARDASKRKDFEAVRLALKDVDPVFRQHIADEEAQVLGLLVAKLGAKGAEAEIQVFRQHRPIYGLMQKVSELASQSSAELEANQSALERLFEEHAGLEETRVFPRALTLRV